MLVESYVMSETLGYRSNFACLEMLDVFELQQKSIDIDDCGEIEFRMFLAFMMALDWNDIIMQNQVLQNYADSLVKWVFAERIQSHGVSDLVVTKPEYSR